MTTLQDSLQDTLIAPLAEDELEVVRELLVAQGFEPRALGPVLQCDRTLLGERIGVLHFYPAERLLGAVDPQCLTAVPRSSESALRLLWDELFSEEYAKTPRMDQYLYAVTNGSALTVLQSSGLLYQVENNMNYARKAVCEAQALPSLLRELFEPVSPSLRAHAVPTLRLLRELRDDLDAAVSVTHWLSPTGSPWSSELLSVDQRDHLSLLYGRLMGRGFGLQWEGVDVLMVNNGAGFPPELASRGERVGFSLAQFLAMAYAHLQPGMTLGIRALLSSLDVMKRLAVFDLLRQLMAVTGVSLVIQEANTDTLRLAQSKFKRIAPAEFR